MATTETAPIELPQNPPEKPADSGGGVGAGQCAPEPPKNRKSHRPLLETLRNASTNLDEILHDLDLSKDETEALLASQKFHSHRQLRTQLLAEQLQLAAQDHAQFAMTRLL